MQHLVNIGGLKFLSPFVGQDMQENSYPFSEEFVVAYAYTQNAKFVRHI
jgi:hypothetical protein